MAKKFISLERLTQYDGLIKALIASADSTTLQSAQDYADGLAPNYDAAGTAQSLVNALANGAVATNTSDITTIKGNIGTMADLAEGLYNAGDTRDLVTALNNINTKMATNGAVTISDSTTTQGYLKSYTFSQFGSTIGVIDIPKDLVVESGSVTTITETTDGHAPGTYIVLTLANDASTTIWIPVTSLIDIYTAEQNATQVQLAVSNSNVLSGSIVAGSIGTTELGSKAVTAAKIADNTITKSQLASDVTDALDLAESGVQSVTEGATNGTIAVDGTDVAVHGLGSAAYTDSTAYDAAGTAQSLVNALANGAVATNTSNISTNATNIGTMSNLNASLFNSGDDRDLVTAINNLQSGDAITDATQADITALFN